MKELASIHLVFENCESAEVPLEAIGNCGFGNLKKQYYMYNINQIGSTTFCEYFYMRFNNLVSLEYDDFDGKKVSLLKRIVAHEDICAIIVNYKDGTRDDFQLAWKTIHNTFRNFFLELKHVKFANGERYYTLVIEDHWNLKKIIKFLKWKLFKVPYYRLTYKRRMKKLYKGK